MSAEPKLKRKRITQSTVKSRGWTLAMIREVLGEPDATAPNPHYSRAGAPMRLYYEDRVIAAESTDEFKAAKAKADRRRESSKKGLSAARTVREAQAILKAEYERAADEAAADRMAEKYICAALSDDPDLTMRDRKYYKRCAHEYLRFLGQQQCEECKWLHLPDFSDQCIRHLGEAHNEAKLAGAVNAIFPMPEDPDDLRTSKAKQGRNSKKSKTKKSGSSQANRYNAADYPDYWSTTVTRQIMCCTSAEVKRRLGEPDRVVTDDFCTVKLYLRSRVKEARANALTERRSS